MQMPLVHGDVPSSIQVGFTTTILTSTIVLERSCPILCESPLAPPLLLLLLSLVAL
jgi:hypothetical protein